MNLFLLTAVPLAAVVLHRLAFPGRHPWAEPKSWILGAVWSTLALIAVAPFGKMREFDGDLLSAGLGLFWTDALLVPGAVVLAWILTRRHDDEWELGLWLTLVFTLAGVRDFAATTQTFDLNELFLVPLDRVLLIATLARLIPAALAGRTWMTRSALWLAAGLLVLTGPVFQVLSFAGWGALVWVLLASGLASFLWFGTKKWPPRSEAASTAL